MASVQHNILNSILYTSIISYWISLINGNDMSTNWYVFKEKKLEGCKKFIPTFFLKAKNLHPLVV